MVQLPYAPVVVAPFTHWVGHKACLIVVANRKILVG